MGFSRLFSRRILSKPRYCTEWKVHDSYSRFCFRRNPLNFPPFSRLFPGMEWVIGSVINGTIVANLWFHPRFVVWSSGQTFRVMAFQVSNRIFFGEMIFLSECDSFFFTIQLISILLWVLPVHFWWPVLLRNAFPMISFCHLLSNWNLYICFRAQECFVFKTHSYLLSFGFIYLNRKSIFLQNSSQYIN